MDNSKKEGGIVQLVVVLGLITFICALLLGVINGVTADKITQNGIETRNAAMAEIIPDADFEDLDTALSAEDVAAAGVTLPAGRTAAQIDGVYKATKDGEEIGYCVQVEPKGFGGNLTMIVGINADGTVAGAKVTSHAETPGLGAKSQADPNWITQFAGQTADCQLKVAKDGVVQATPDRSALFAVQTPQVFEIGLIQGALAHALEEGAVLTDDCSAVERIGFPICLTQGSEDNLKITTPRDLTWGEAILAERMR